MELINLSESPSLLEVRHLTKIFTSGGLFRKSSITAVNDVSFEISGDEAVVTALVGESGSGKTTLSRVILGLLNPTSGEVKYRGKSIHTMSKKEHFNYQRKVQAVFQDPYEIYNPFYEVDRILKVPIRKFKLASTDAEERKMIAEALKLVDLKQEDVLGKYPHQLSGGQRQRLAIMRAFLSNPEIIVADEPVSMIDASLRAGILHTMLNLKEEHKTSYLYITHDLSTAYYLSDNIIVLHRGHIVESGDIDAVIKNPFHPYLQVLIASVPIADPEKKWTEKAFFKVDQLYKSEDVKLGCSYYNRCPKAMDICAKERPDNVMVERNHYVACHLYSKKG